MLNKEAVATIAGETTLPYQHRWKNDTIPPTCPDAR